MKKRFCVNCGNVLDEDDTFCDNCGSKIDSSNYDNRLEEKKETKKKEKKEEVEETKIEEKEEKKETSVLKHREEEDVTDSVLGYREVSRKTKEKDNSSLIIVIIVATIIFLIGIIFTVVYVDYKISKIDTKGSSNTSSTINKNVTVVDNGIADAVEKVNDAVVIIKVYARNTLYSTGTGFVYDTDDTYAYILTNSHVVSGSNDVRVVFTNEKEYAVEVLGSDDNIDVAVLQIEKDKILSVAAIGDATALRVGDTSFAIGSPIDSDTYPWTVTKGIISGKDRLVETSSTFGSTGTVLRVLQTDTAINSGNSGGPLCNANGEVVGITNMKLVDSSVEGIAFAVPIDTAVEYATKIRNGEDTTIKPYLGVGFYNNSFFNSSDGVYVAQVDADGPIAKAGIKVGDYITKIGDVKVNSPAFLRYELYKYQPGDKIKVTYVRGNKTYTTTVALSSTPKQ